MEKLEIEGKRYGSLNEAIKKLYNKDASTVNEKFDRRCEIELNKKRNKEKSKLLEETVITLEDFCKLVEDNSNIIEELYEDKDVKDKVHYILSNISKLSSYGSDISLEMEISLLVKFLNFARICSRIKLSKGQMLKLLYTNKLLDPLLVKDYIFIDFLLDMYEYEEKEIDDKNVVIDILYFFKHILEDKYLMFSKIVNNKILENININADIYNVSRYIKSCYDLDDDIIKLIIRNIDITINNFVDGYIEMVYDKLTDDESSIIMKNILEG